MLTSILNASANVARPDEFVILISKGSFAFVKFDLFFATTNVTCVALSLVTVSGVISVAPSSR